MRTTVKLCFALLTCFILASCEEVVNVDLGTAQPRLVVDASINWEKGTDGSEQHIRLTTTAPYYNGAVPVVSGATVFITNADGTQFDFLEQVSGTGDYVCTAFVPEINMTYTLTVAYAGEFYTASEMLYATPDITHIEQDDQGGFLHEDYELRFYFQDNGLENNYYLYRYDSDVLPYPDYDAIDDEFFQGNEMFGIFSDEDLGPGKTVNISLLGISERYYNYMNKLIAIAEGGSGGGPFQTPPATVRGNLVNQTDADHYALGYFRLGETTVVPYTFE